MVLLDQMKRPDVPQTLRGSELPVRSDCPGFERIRARTCSLNMWTGWTNEACCPRFGNRCATSSARGLNCRSRPTGFLGFERTVLQGAHASWTAAGISGAKSCL